METLETEIAQWRTAVLRNKAVDASDADELESHLREQIADLEKAGLHDDEAFLVAVKRLGEVDRVTAEFARVHGERIWKQLAVAQQTERIARPLLTVIGFALIAGVLVQGGRLLADATHGWDWLLRDLSLFVLPVLGAYFAIVNRMPPRRWIPLAGIVVVLALAANLYPFAHDEYGDPGATSALVAIHLPVVLWFLAGAAYLAGDVRSSARRMDLIRFSGEWAIYYVLIALGGAVLVGLTMAVLAPISSGTLSYDVVALWVVPTGAAGAVFIAAWLVEAKKSIIENLAPVLTAIFTPLFAAMLLVSVVVYSVAGVGREFDRDILTVFDILLLVVVGLVVYGISARSSGDRAGLMDVIRLVAVIAAVLLDLLVLISLIARVGELGVTPNRCAAIGLNVILLVNLIGTATLTIRMLAKREPVARLERWQTGYLPVFAGWAALVVLVLPPVFRFA